METLAGNDDDGGGGGGTTTIRIRQGLLVVVSGWIRLAATPFLFPGSAKPSINEWELESRLTRRV